MYIVIKREKIVIKIIPCEIYLFNSRVIIGDK